MRRYLLLILFLIGVSYAAYRMTKPNVVVDSVRILSIELSNLKVGVLEESLWEKEIGDLKGVRACKINLKGHIASLVYDSNVISEKDLISCFNKQCSAQKIDLAEFAKTAPAGSQCPVADMKGWFDWF